jgi:hypothetical protein
MISNLMTFMLLQMILMCLYNNYIPLYNTAAHLSLYDFVVHKLHLHARTLESG